MRPDPFDLDRSSSPSSGGDREPYAYERERLITERERLRRKYDRDRIGDDLETYDDREKRLRDVRRKLGRVD
jgi:penicillin-binding protein 1A